MYIDAEIDLKPGVKFWAVERKTHRRADFTGYCTCTKEYEESVHGIDEQGCPRNFSKRTFYFQRVE